MYSVAKTNNAGFAFRFRRNNRKNTEDQFSKMIWSSFI